MIHTRLHRCLSMTGETWRAQKRRSSVLGTLMLSTLPILTWCALPLPDASQIALGTWQWEIPALNGGFNGKIIYTYVYKRIYIYTWGCSIAMFDYRRLVTFFSEEECDVLSSHSWSGWNSQTFAVEPAWMSWMEHCAFLWRVNWVFEHAVFFGEVTVFFRIRPS
jgi:hypothetical protein